MDYFEVRLRIPKPRWNWLRYRVSALLLLMLLVAFICAVWRLHTRQPSRQQLLQELRTAQAARDHALFNWRRAAADLRWNGNSKAELEAAARIVYFQRRAQVEQALTLIVENKARPN